MGEPSFVVGIDLGTTNSVLAYSDLREGKDDAIQSLSVPQFIGENTVGELSLLPSFLYSPLEQSRDGASLPWKTDPGERFLVGAFARTQSGLLPSRVIQSSKSWLSHSRVDREGPILPWGLEGLEPKVSPLEASSAVLKHLRKAWDHQMAGGDPTLSLSQQDVVVTIPASFDEVARALTLKAARAAGLDRVTLVEEPQAAFYWWIESHRERWEEALPMGGIVLVCDIGGGTTDLSLIRVSPRQSGPPSFERLAVGRHLLLGGDNVDNALARGIEADTKRKLDIRQWVQLVSRCRAAKEQILGEDSPEKLKIQVPGSSSKLIGGSLSVEMTREKVEALILDGFLPALGSEDPGARRTRTGFVQQGLPYEQDPAVTRHILGFLRSQFAHGPSPSDEGILQPDAILFNGGATRSGLVQRRIAEVVGSWFGKGSLPMLSNLEPERAVSLGAATYGRSRRGEGIRIRGGSARSFYVTLHGDESLCVLPHGSEEGALFTVKDKRLSARTNQTVAFQLSASSTRMGDKAGDVVRLTPDEKEPLPPLLTLLEYGKAGKEESLAVQLKCELTPLGTISMWCSSVNSPHEWRLEFALEQTTRHEGAVVADSGHVEQAKIEEAEGLIRDVFRGDSSPTSLMKRLEGTLGRGRETWALSTLRSFWPVLREVASERGRSAAHEARWFNLTGYCLRPGFGEPGDSARLKGFWRETFGQGVTHTSSSEVWREWWVLWRRASGGLRPGQQTEVLGSIQRLLGGKKLDVARLGRGAPDKAELQELWMAAASLERVPVASRIKLGRQALKYLKTDAMVRYGYWVLGRLGARGLLYAGADSVLPPKEIESWVKELVPRSWKKSSKVAFELAQLGRMTGDRSLDLSEGCRGALIQKVTDIPEHQRALEILESVVELDSGEQGRLLADSVPRGLVWVEKS